MKKCQGSGNTKSNKVTDVKSINTINTDNGVHDKP